MKNFTYLLLLAHCAAHAMMHEITEEEIVFSGLHPQGTITNRTKSTIIIEFWKQSHFHKHKGIMKDIQTLRIRPKITVQADESIVIDQGTTSIKVQEGLSQICSSCLINPTHTYSLQKSAALKLIDETIQASSAHISKKSS